jgi:hypothetical protein
MTCKCGRTLLSVSHYPKELALFNGCPPLFCHNSRVKIKMSTENWWNNIGRRKRKYRKTCPGATLSTTKLKWTELG